MDFFQGHEFAEIEPALEHIKYAQDGVVVEMNNKFYASNQEEVNKLIEKKIVFQYWVKYPLPMCPSQSLFINVPVN